MLAVHDTPVSSGKCPPALAIVWSAQWLPFQRSASPVPVAVQAFAAVQETASSSPTDEPPRLGVVWIFQVLPFHTSASVAKLGPVLELPTASHTDPAGQETPLSWLLSAPLAFWVVWIFQVLPFHTSARVRVAPLPLVNWPTASHEDADRQAIALSWLSAAPGGLGVDWVLHVLPFHTSARTSVTPPLLDEPTASQKEADVHETPGSCPPPGSGMLTTVQVPPLRVSARRWLSVVPTAIQKVPDGQDTALKLHIVAPEGGGVDFCSQLAAAGCAAVSSAAVSSAAVTSAPAVTKRFITSSTPPECSPIKRRGLAAALRLTPQGHRLAGPAARRETGHRPPPTAGAVAG